MAKDRQYYQLLNSKQWLRLRREVPEAHPICQRCEEEGRLRAACEVHHIHPVEEAFTYAERISRAYDPNNLRALCHECHVLTHTEMGRSGKVANKERNDKHTTEAIDKLYGDGRRGTSTMFD